MRVRAAAMRIATCSYIQYAARRGMLDVPMNLHNTEAWVCLHEIFIRIYHKTHALPTSLIVD